MKRNGKHSSIRARVEHVFRVIRHQFGFTKARYRGLMKNTTQVNMLVGLANLYLLRWRLMAPERRVVRSLHCKRAMKQKKTGRFGNEMPLRNGLPVDLCCEMWQHHLKIWKTLFVQRFLSVPHFLLGFSSNLFSDALPLKSVVRLMPRRGPILCGTSNRAHNSLGASGGRVKKPPK